MSATAQPTARTENLPATTTLRDVLPGLDGKTWFITRLDEQGRAGFGDAFERAYNSRGDAVGAGQITDMTARDPRGIGVRGGYPQVNQGLPNQAQMLRTFVRFAYRRSPVARILVDSIASMVWGEWVDLESTDEAVKKALENVFKNPTGKPGERPLYWWLERAYRLARRDGRCLLYFSLEDTNSATPKLAPLNVKGIRGVAIVREDNIQEAVVDPDPTSRTYGQIVAWRISTSRNSSLGAAGTTVEVHADRVLPAIPYPVEEDPSQGESILALNINPVEMVENLVWASAEAYFTLASPYIVVSLDKEVMLSPEEKADAKKQIAQLQQSSTQRIFLRGVTVTVLQGSAQLADPLPHWEVAMQQLAISLGGMPVSTLTGNQAGKLTGAVEDSARAQGIVSKIQEQDADPMLNSLIHRLVEWGVKEWGQPGESPVSFKWRPLFEPDPKSRGEAELALAQARSIYVDRKMPPPESLEYQEGEWPKGFDEEEQKEAAEKAAAAKQPFGEGGSPAAGDAGKGPPSPYGASTSRRPRPASPRASTTR